MRCFNILFLFMKTKNSNIIIIGAGLTGLTIAYLLRKQNISVQIVEARGRVGGRIDTKYSETLAPQEMGATWLGKKHTALVDLLQTLNIGIFEQELGKKAIYEAISTSPPQLVSLPSNDEPSYRIQGGTSTLIHALANQLEGSQISLNQIVTNIFQEENSIVVQSQTQEFRADKVISTLPPNLFFKTISVTPPLPDLLKNISKNTHTWMGESIKIALTFVTPFWRKNASGTIFSNVGPISEMYDHANYENDRFALKGFLNGAYFSLSKSERLDLIINQLQKYYGSEVRNFLTYEEAVWRKEKFTFADYENHVLPHQNNGHSVFQQSFFNGKLFIAGSETATQFPGYMEGAVQSAISICERIDGGRKTRDDDRKTTGLLIKTK